jgi:NADH:ubiquinone oxidoreductase subunit E
MNETNPMANDSAEAIDYLALDRLVEDRFDNDKENLIMILQAIQAQYNYLPRPVLSYLSEKIEIPLSRIYGVATFYSTFSLEPRGKNIISICLGTACHVRGGGKVMDRIEETLHVRNGETTDDGQFTLESVRCIGCCSLGPVVKINEDVYGRIGSEDLAQILDHYGESKIETGGQ